MNTNDPRPTTNRRDRRGPSNRSIDGSSRDTDVLIIGASQAGVQLAVSLRREGFTGRITLLGAEDHPPYQRPPLSKAALQGLIALQSLHFRSEDFYTAQGIDLVLGARVVSVATGPDGSGEALTEHGTVISFGRLALTVGARPRRLPIPGADSDGVYYLRDAADSDRLRAALTPDTRVLVVGGGFIGLEVAASARTLGCQTSVVLADDRVMARAVGPHISDAFRDAHNRRGVNIHVATIPVRMLANTLGHVRAVELSDGTTVQADVVVVGIGASPRTELAEQMGLAVDDGIVVDEHGLTSDGYTVAAGDCANSPNPIAAVSGPGRMRFESVSTAIDQAKTAAATLAGRKDAYRAVPWFWTDQFDLKLQAAGLIPATGECVVRGDVMTEKFSVLYFDQDRLVAGECVNRPADFLVVRQALDDGRTIDRAAAADAATPLKKTVRDLHSDLGSGMHTAAKVAVPAAVS
jgi:3-phenylpropionate/trans-cinnamate dioxygenase ferredoxin reductase subunit